MDRGGLWSGEGAHTTVLGGSTPLVTYGYRGVRNLVCFSQEFAQTYILRIERSGPLKDFKLSDTEEIKSIKTWLSAKSLNFGV